MISKKIFSLLLSGILLTAFAFPVSALGNNVNSYQLNIVEMEQERDQIGGGYYRDYAKAFESIGLTFDDVKSLQNQGLSYDDILKTSNKVKNLLDFGIQATRPSTFVRVTNVAGSTEYYHPNAGLVAGDFYNDNDGDWIEGQIESFIGDVYGSTSNMTYMYYLFGEWDNTYQTHQGTDMYKTTSNPKLYSAHEGEVVTIGATGRVGIYDGDVTYFYAHCANRQVSVGDYVEIGDYIADEGSVGATSAHLHFEVRNGKTTSMGLQNTSLNSLNPYDYM